MLIFQMQTKEAGDGSESESSHFGVRSRKRKGFADDASADSLSVASDGMAAEMFSARRIALDKDASDFVSTLTPGAQNAIHAASFAWGYENAARYLKNAMKLDEVKNADNAVEKSKAVIQSMQAQAGKSEVSSEVSKFVWGYYNEDLKETQAQAGKTETITEKANVGSAERAQTREQERMHAAMPATSQEAVFSSICAGSLSPTILYCAGAYQEAAAAQEHLATTARREDFAKLIVDERAKTARIRAEKDSEEKQREIAAEAVKIALQRHNEELEAFEKTEKQLQDAIKTLDKFGEDEKEKLKKIAAMLPDGLSRNLLLQARRLAKKRALRAQLAKWAAFCSEGKKSLASMPSSRIIKLVFLSSFFSLGKK